MQPGSAVDRHEAILANTAAFSRLVACLYLAGPAYEINADRPILLAGVVVSGAYSIGSAWAYWRSHLVRGRWVVVDFVVYGGLLLAGTSLPKETGLPGNPFFNQVLLLSVVFGLPRWPAWRTIAVGFGLGVVLLIGDVVLVGRTSLLWNVLPDALQFPGNATILWVIASQLRAAARRIDDARLAATRREAEVARQQEHVRLAEALRRRVLVTLESLAQAAAVDDERLRHQLRADVTWLRAHLAGVPDDGDVDLSAELRRLAANRRRTGLAIELALPPVLPPLRGTRIRALVAAAREAVNNVHKHAGTATATIEVHCAQDGVAVTVADHGRGFEPHAVRAGIGLDGSIRGRLADAGGHAEIESRPGQGTMVTLWVPAG
ncbi:sensor histidine kinase [Microbispora siamensis]|uniref:Histidine kinase/HSP90-like ATPase domain-containing protein n=1 Tax=Microbispora siamensis TaxID=564413 RepID=A0ABQ4GLW9_9ACTN|nr:ATP-binding protein [Microbispora siamensis]GIH62420.1 hypothetical protein Msi02_32370 [Microbispora siamensis]